MTEPKPFHPSEAKDVLTDASEGDVLLPIVLPNPDIMMGENLAIVVLTTIEDQRVGIPMGYQAISNLHQLLGAALRILQKPEGGSIQ